VSRDIDKSVGDCGTEILHQRSSSDASISNCHHGRCKIASAAYSMNSWNFLLGRKSAVDVTGHLMELLADSGLWRHVSSGSHVTLSQHILSLFFMATDNCVYLVLLTCAEIVHLWLYMYLMFYYYYKYISFIEV